MHAYVHVHVYKHTSYVIFYISVNMSLPIFFSFTLSLSLGTALLSSLRLFLRHYLLPPDGAALSASSALREPLWRPLAPPSHTTPPLLVCSLPPRRERGRSLGRWRGWGQIKSPLQTSSPSLPRNVSKIVMFCTISVVQSPLFTYIAIYITAIYITLSK